MMVSSLFPGLFQATPGTAPLPATPPVGGLVWTVVVPATLLLGSFLATYLLYRRFARREAPRGTHERGR